MLVKNMENNNRFVFTLSSFLCSSWFSVLHGCIQVVHIKKKKILKTNGPINLPWLNLHNNGGYKYNCTFLLQEFCSVLNII